MKLKELLEKKAKELREQIDKSEDIAEVRALGETLKAVLEELKELDSADDSEEQGEEMDDTRSAIPKNAKFRTLGSFSAKKPEARDRHDTVEYRTAFMEYVCRGVEIPRELRTDEVTGVADASAVIPTTIMNEIVQSMESYGNVYALVRKLNVQGGVSIPILSLKPEATWIGEGKSESKKVQANESVVFNYYGVECKIAQTLLANVTTLDMFQRLFVPLATEAIVKAVEIAIFNGTGSGQPLGITKDSRVTSANVITMKPSEFTSWEAWHKKVKAKIKKAYRNGTLFMNQATFDGYIDGMVDQNGQPIARTNYGIDGGETYRFMGKAVETVEDGCIPAFDDALSGDVVAVYMNPTDYAINSNMQLTVVKWINNDTNEVNNKAIMICDGKLVDATGVLVIKKGTE